MNEFLFSSGVMQGIAFVATGAGFPFQAFVGAGFALAVTIFVLRFFASNNMGG